MTEETTATPQPGLTVQDLTLTLQVIQVASSRGAFKADELTAIGGLYDRIFKFLESSGAIVKNPPPEEQPQPVAEATPTATVTAKSSKPAAMAAAAKGKKVK
jgi:hypothetical protein